MARRGRGGMGLGPMSIVIAIIVGLIIAIALYSFVPVIGYQISASTTIPAASGWGASNLSNFGATNATNLWGSTGGLPVIMIIAIVIGGAIAIFMGI